MASSAFLIAELPCAANLLLRLSVTVHSKSVNSAVLSALLYTVYCCKSTVKGSINVAGLFADNLMVSSPKGEILNRILAEGSSTPCPTYDLIPGYLASRSACITDASLTRNCSNSPSEFGKEIITFEFPEKAPLLGAKTKACFSASIFKLYVCDFGKFCFLN